MPLASIRCSLAIRSAGFCRAMIRRCRSLLLSGLPTSIDVVAFLRSSLRTDDVTTIIRRERSALRLEQLGQLGSLNGVRDVKFNTTRRASSCRDIRSEQCFAYRPYVDPLFTEMLLIRLKNLPQATNRAAWRSKDGAAVSDIPIFDLAWQCFAAILVFHSIYFLP